MKLGPGPVRRQRPCAQPPTPPAPAPADPNPPPPAPSPGRKAAGNTTAAGFISQVTTQTPTKPNTHTNTHTRAALLAVARTAHPPHQRAVPPPRASNAEGARHNQEKRTGRGGWASKIEVVDFRVKLEHEERLRDEVGKTRMMPRGLRAGPPKACVNQTALSPEGPCPLHIP